MSYQYDPPLRKGGGYKSAASRKVFHEQVEPTLSKRQREYLEVVRRHPAGVTNKEVAALLGKLSHEVSGRRSELEGKGLLRGTGQRRDDAEVLVAVYAQQQQELFQGAA